MHRTIKPKKARSKRVLDAREPQEIESARTAIFVKTTHTTPVVQSTLKSLQALKRPDAIAFNKKNTVRPFEDTASLTFWSQKNDASLFLIGSSSKKRPDNLVLVRMFDYQVLDMLELGILPTSDIKSLAADISPGHKPLLHFASPLFDTEPIYGQVKSMLLSFFNGEEIPEICLPGIQHVVSVTLSPLPPSSSTTPSPTSTIHIRTYTIKYLSSGTRIPKVSLTPTGPTLDLCIRRHTPPDSVLLKSSLARPKVKKTDVEKGLGKKRKNIEVDDMGDKRGTIHVPKQDLGKLQTRKMKGLKRQKTDGDGDEEMEMES